MLINGFQYIIPCQCRFSRTPIDQIIAEQYQNVSTIIKDCLKDSRILITDQRAKQAFSALPRSKTYGRKRSDPANFQRFPEAGFGNRFRAPVPIDFRHIRVSGPY